MKHYSSVNVIQGLSCSVLVHFWDLGNLRKLGLNITNNREGYTKIDPMCSTPHFTYQMRPYSSVKTISGLNYICFSVFRALVQVREIRPKYITQMMSTDTQEAIQSVKLCISYQMKPYASVKAIWESGYTCFSVFVALEKGGEIPQIPKIMKRDKRKVLQSVQLYISYHVKPYSMVKAFWRLSFDCFSIFGLWDKMGKLGLNTPNNEHGYKKSHPKC